MGHFGKRSIVVDGTTVNLDVNTDLPIADVSADMDRVASQMAWWASVWAAAEREAAEADAHYRAWRARTVNEILAKQGSLAEWKVKALIEADPRFLEFKTAIARGEENVTLARGIFDCFDKKANALQSKGAMQRSELGATGMTTPERPRSARGRPVSTDADDGDSVDADAMEARRDRVRTIFRNKGKHQGDDE